MKKYSTTQVVGMMIAQAILGSFIATAFRGTVEAQQRPYTTYQLPYQQCLVITAQGYAVVLDYPCQH